MAARTTTFDYSDLDLKIDGTELQGLINCNLTINLELAETVAAAPTAWQDYCKGLVDWTISGSGGWIETAAECGVGATLKLDGSNAMLGVADCDYTFDVAMSEISAQSSGGFREYAPSLRTMTMNMNGMYYDPANAATNEGGLYDCVAERTSSLSVIQTFGTGSTLSFTGYPSTYSLDRSRGEHVKIAATIMATGAVTDGTAGQATIDSFLTKLYSEAAITALLTSSSAGDTELSGSTYVQSFGISIPMSGRIEYNFVLRGSGVLTDGIVGA